MAPLLSLVRDVVAAVEGAGSLEDGRLAAAHAADAFRSALDARVEYYRPQIDHYRYAVGKLYGLADDAIDATLLFVTAGVVRDV